MCASTHHPAAAGPCASSRVATHACTETTDSDLRQLGSSETSTPYLVRASPVLPVEDTIYSVRNSVWQKSFIYKIGGCTRVLFGTHCSGSTQNSNLQLVAELRLRAWKRSRHHTYSTSFVTLCIHIAWGQRRKGSFLQPTPSRCISMHQTIIINHNSNCLLYTSPSPRDGLLSRMPSSA